MSGYYELTKPWEPELIGVQDGLSQAAVFESGFKDSRNFEEFMRVFADPNHFSLEDAMRVEFDLEGVKLKKGAILTDFLWFSPMRYYLVSDKVYSILQKYSLGKHRFFTARIEDSKGEFIDEYHFFYREILDWDVINFRRCEFIKGNDYDGYKNVSIKSKDEYLKDRFVEVKRVVLRNIPDNVDLLKVKLPVGILISDRLYQEFDSAIVTGIKLRKIEIEVRED